VFSRLFRRVSANIAAGRSFAGPAGKRLYAVGDIHGRLDLLDDLLGQIEDDIFARPVGSAVVVFLGDLIDRGPDSQGVIERLRNLAPFPAQTFVLLGNHEEMLLRTLQAEPGVAYDWLNFGGDICVESYGVAPAALTALDEARIAEVLHAAILSRSAATASTSATICSSTPASAPASRSKSSNRAICAGFASLSCRTRMTMVA
jgi:serine/threonine protein phosphatase 1